MRRHGYLGFNRESQLSITIRTAVCKDGLAHFNVGAGIVADSNPAAEYEETLAKAAGFSGGVESTADGLGWTRITGGEGVRLKKNTLAAGEGLADDRVSSTLGFSKGPWPAAGGL